MSKEEILKKGCDLLYKNEYVKQGFYEDVLKEKKSVPPFSEAGLHCHTEW